MAELYTLDSELSNLKMAEVIGVVASGMTLASIFGACIRAINLFETGQSFAVDHTILLTKLKVEQCRLYQLGETIGLAGNEPEASSSGIDSSPFRSLIIQILNAINLLFDDAEKIENRYGCVLSSSSQRAQALTLRLEESFDIFMKGLETRQKTATLTRKARWIIKDKNKFSILISDLRDLVDGLLEITKSLASISVQTVKLQCSIMEIEDAQSLDLIRQACVEDHRDLSETASTRLELLSLADNETAFQDRVEQWVQDMEPLKPGRDKYLSKADWTDFIGPTVAGLDTLALRMYNLQFTKLQKSVQHQLANLYWQALCTRLGIRKSGGTMLVLPQVGQGICPADLLADGEKQEGKVVVDTDDFRGVQTYCG